MNNEFTLRLDLLEKHFDVLLGTQYDSFSACPQKILEIYARSIERDLHILQMSILSDIQFEIEHNIGRGDVKERIQLAKQIGSDLLHFNMQRNG